MSKPKRLRYPRGLIGRASVRLRVKMRRLVNLIQKGKITKVEGRARGIRILKDHYDMLVVDINDYLEKRNLARALRGTEAEMEVAKTEALDRWDRILARL